MNVSFDSADVLKGIQELEAQATSIGRHMAVAVGAAMRDAAKANVRSRSGRLKSAIVLKYAEEGSSTTNAQYVVTWNRKKAPHGHLVEFGHWNTHETFLTESGEIRTGKLLPRDQWTWTKPKAFLRRAQITVGPQAMPIAMAAGRARWDELARGGA